MDSENQQIAALVDDIRRTPQFRVAPARTALLDYLVARRKTYVMARTLAKEALGIAREDFAAESNRLRERCNDLRNALARYQDAQGALWRCEFPSASRGRGYRLEFKKLSRVSPASELFWTPHLQSPKCPVVCNELLFFFDPEHNSALRFFDTNEGEKRGEDGGELGAKETLKRNHPDFYNDRLSPIHFYLSTGELAAFDVMRLWLAKVKVEAVRRSSREIQKGEILGSSPILLGTRHTNKYVRQILDSPEARHLSYRFHDTLGAIQIKQPKAEIAALSSQYPITPDGILGPVPNWEVIFGTFTRLPNPGGSGSMTIISSDYSAHGMVNIALALTNDEGAKKLLTQMGLSMESTLPPSFEMLFAMRLAPGGIEGAISNAELIAWRLHS